MFSRIDRLKRIARNSYLEYMRELDKMSCGASIAEHVNARVCKARETFNNAMSELKNLDENCPDFRL